MEEERREELRAEIRELGRRVPAFAERVAPLYVILNWTWLGKPRPPTVEMIQNTLDSLVDDAKAVILKPEFDEDKEWASSTGGLEVRYAREGQFYMSFTVDELV